MERAIADKFIQIRRCETLELEGGTTYDWEFCNLQKQVSQTVNHCPNLMEVVVQIVRGTWSSPSTSLLLDICAGQITSENDERPDLGLTGLAPQAFRLHTYRTCWLTSTGIVRAVTCEALAL